MKTLAEAYGQLVEAKTRFGVGDTVRVLEPGYPETYTVSEVIGDNEVAMYQVKDNAGKPWGYFLETDLKKLAMTKTALPTPGTDVAPSPVKLQPPEEDPDYYSRMPTPHDEKEKAKKPAPKAVPPKEKKELPPKEKKQELPPKEKSKSQEELKHEQDLKEEQEFNEKFPHDKMRGPLKPTQELPKDLKKYTEDKPDNGKGGPQGKGPISINNPAYKSMFQRINKPVEKDTHGKGQNGPRSTRTPVSKQPKTRQKPSGGKGGGGWQKGPKGGTFRVGPSGKKEYRHGELATAYASLEKEAMEYQVGDRVTVLEYPGIPSFFYGEKGTIQSCTMPGKCEVQFADGRTAIMPDGALESENRR